MSKEAWLGVDIGGTWMRVLAVDARGRALRYARRRSPAAACLAQELHSLLKAWGLKPRAMVLGLTGFGRAADRRRLEGELARVTPCVKVLSDLELAWRAALGGPGVLILAGTGSFAFGRDAKGRSARVGGLGPYLGDEGSAFWIGREWLRSRSEREALAYAHRPRPQAAIASLAPRILRAAKARPASLERRIMTQAQNSLALQAREVASLLRFKGKVPVSWHGGLMSQADFREGVFRRLGPRFAPAAPRSSPERTAAELALRLAKPRGSKLRRL